MKCISIKQPWADLIVRGIKDIENRSWSTSYRGRILIHASLKPDYWAMEHISHPPILINYGCIVGEVEIVDCVTKSNSKWFKGPYGFVLKNPKILPFKALKGKLGIFDVDYN